MKCNASDLIGSTVDVVECECGFAWQFPVAHSSDDSREWFEHAYEDGGATKSQYFSEEAIESRTALQLAFLNEVAPQPTTLLDVGAGTGRFAAAAASAGWRATAVDPALDVSRLSGFPSLHPVRGSLDDLPAGLQFGVVTAWDVIEHVDHPIRFINDISSRLKSGGWCLIETGNYMSTMRLTEGNNWGLYQRDHRWYFSPDTLGNLLNTLGFEGLVISDRVMRPGWKGGPKFPGPSWIRTLRRMARHPMSIKGTLRRHFLEASTRSWPHGNLWVFVIAARKK